MSNLCSRCLYKTQYNPPRSLRPPTRLARRLHRGLALSSRPLGPHGKLHSPRRRRHSQRRTIRKRGPGITPQVYSSIRSRTTDYYVKDWVQYLIVLTIHRVIFTVSKAELQYLRFFIIISSSNNEYLNLY